MPWFLTLWLLAQPADECLDRSPGLSRCVEYEKQPDGKVSCRAACHYGRRPDGGTYGEVVRAKDQKDNATCLFELKRQATNNCKPVQKRR